MRYLAIFLVYVVCTWVLIEVPWPGEDLASDAAALASPTFINEPSFELAVARDKDLEAANRQGRLREDPRMRRLREDVIRAGERLQQDVCDGHLREEFARATFAFVRPVEEMARDRAKLPKVERLELNGKVVSTSQYLNSKAMEIIFWARTSGGMYREDVPRDLRWLRSFMFSRKNEMVAGALSMGC